MRHMAPEVIELNGIIHVPWARVTINYRDNGTIIYCVNGNVPAVVNCGGAEYGRAYIPGRAPRIPTLAVSSVCGLEYR